MFYVLALTIPANTAKADAVEEEVHLVPGTITHVEVHLPPGCAGLVHVQIDVGERQIWPADPDTDFSGDGVNIVFGEEFEVLEPPYVVRVRGWNSDDTYAHTPIVRIGLTPARVSLISTLRRAFGA